MLKTELPGEMEDNTYRFCDATVFLRTGYNLKFFTSALTDKDGMEWMCVFDLGLVLDGTHAFKDLPRTGND